MQYLRELQLGRKPSELEIFEGDIKKDRAYWKKYHNAISVRYFKLQEVKI